MGSGGRSGGPGGGVCRQGWPMEISVVGGGIGQLAFISLRKSPPCNRNFHFRSSGMVRGRPAEPGGGGHQILYIF